MAAIGNVLPSVLLTSLALCLAVGAWYGITVELSAIGDSPKE